MKVIALVIFTTLVIGCSSDRLERKPDIKPLIEAVYASGYVVSENEYQIIAQAEGYVTEKLIHDGDAVNKGDALYILESDQQSARYRIAKEAFALADKNYREQSPVLAELRAMLNASKTKLQFDSLNFVRYENLHKQQATSQAEYDRMKLLYENSKQEYTLQESRYNKTKDQLELEWKNARNQLKITADESGRYIIRSAVEGIVFRTYKENGEMIRRGELVAVAGTMNSFYLQLNVDELDAHRVQSGQKVFAKIDAYPDKIFEAHVTRVYPYVDKQRQSIRVDAMLTESLPGTISGLALEANIIIRERKQALVIPKAYLLAGDSVLIKKNDIIQKQKITKGIETLDEVEIIHGIDSATIIIK